MTGADQQWSPRVALVFMTLTMLVSNLICTIGLAATSARAIDPTELAVGIYYFDSNGENICSGIIISRTLVLTAGHCACGDSETYIVTGWHQMPIKIFRAHVTRVLVERSQGRKIKNRAVDKNSRRAVGQPILFDPNQCARGGTYVPGTDLALLSLGTGGDACNGQPCGMEYVETFWETRQRTKETAEFRSIGYGKTETGSFGTRIDARIRLLTLNCYPPVSGKDCAPFKEMILRSKRTDSCAGDSGGPVFRLQDGEWRLVAALSRGARECGSGDGGIYTLLGRRVVLDWIQNNIQREQILRAKLQTKIDGDQKATSITTRSLVPSSPFGTLDRTIAR